jgi:hypothetical protein
MVVQLYPQAMDSLFVASYDTQGCGGGIRPRLHIGYFLTFHYISITGYDPGHIENTAFNSFLLACVFVVARTCLPNSCTSTGRLCWLHIPDFSR